MTSLEDDPAAPGTWRRGMAAAWLVAWIVTAALIAVTRYESRDPDSQLYAGISARLTTEPVRQWIAPEWWGFWNSYGPYCEHPVGMFVVPAALGLAGYPAGQTAYAVNALYQVVAFALITLIAVPIVGRRQALVIGTIVQLLPIAFVFRIRANQEYAVLAGLLFALYATERARERAIWIAGMLAGFSAVLLVKGVFAFMVPLVCGLWLIARSESLSAVTRPRGPWLAVLLMPVLGLVIAVAYESAYVHVTGRSFLAVYQSRQLPESAITEASPLTRTAYNAAWYASRVLWYPFPWSVAAVAVGVGLLRRRQWLPAFSRPDWLTRPRIDGAWFGLVAALAVTAAFSLAHRKADRYIFPVYFFLGGVGGAALLSWSPRLRRVAERFDRPWTPAAVYLVLVLISFAARGKLPVLTFWRS